MLELDKCIYFIAKLIFDLFLSKIFDNEEYDCRTPEDWLALGKSDASPDWKPIPAKALLPIDDEIDGKMFSGIHYVKRDRNCFPALMHSLLALFRRGS